MVVAMDRSEQGGGAGEPVGGELQGMPVTIDAVQPAIGSYCGEQRFRMASRPQRQVDRGHAGSGSEQPQRLPQKHRLMRAGSVQLGLLYGWEGQHRSGNLSIKVWNPPRDQQDPGW